MGQKTAPNFLRLGIYKNHDAEWFENKKNFSIILCEDLTIREYIQKKFTEAFISRILINRTRDLINIKIFLLKPSLIIGKKGIEINTLTKYLEKLTSKKVRFEILDIKKPEVNAAVVAKMVANDLRKRVASPRRIMKKYVFNAKKNNVLGIRIECSGRLLGGEIARSDWYQEGSVPRQKLRANIDYFAQPSFASWGVTGVKVWIYKGDNMWILTKKYLKNKGKNNA